MKKLFLLAIATVTVFAVNAQTTKHKTKSKTPSKQSLAAAKFQKAQADKKMAWENQMDSLRRTDSLRLASDSLSDVQKDSLRAAYRAQGMAMRDSMNKLNYTTLMQQNEAQAKADQSEMTVADKAKLSAYQENQVKVINQTYNDKAKTMLAGADPSTQKAALSTLNDERRAKIRAIVGKSRERKLDYDRASYAKKNGGSDMDSKWIDVAEMK